MVKVKAKAVNRVTIKKAPVKAGSTHQNTTGGIFTTKVVAITKKRKKAQKR